MSLLPTCVGGSGREGGEGCVLHRLGREGRSGCGRVGRGRGSIRVVALYYLLKEMRRVFYTGRAQDERSGMLKPRETIKSTP